MQVTLLGMNGPYPAAGGACSGYLVQSGEDCIALDLGCGTLARLTERMPPEKLTALVFSHWHGDHCSDLLALIYRLESVRQQLGEAYRPLPVYGPADDASPVRQAAQKCTALSLHTLAPGDCLSLGNVHLEAFAARHPVPAVMLRLCAEGKILCYTGDTNETPACVQAASEADLLLADGLFPSAVWSADKPHLSAEKCALLAREAGVKQLIITHLNPAYDPATLLKEAQRVLPQAQLAKLGQTVKI